MKYWEAGPTPDPSDLAVVIEQEEKRVTVEAKVVRFP
jgi:hypothetical protein